MDALEVTSVLTIGLVSGIVVLAVLLVFAGLILAAGYCLCQWFDEDDAWSLLGPGKDWGLDDDDGYSHYRDSSTDWGRGRPATPVQPARQAQPQPNEPHTRNGQNVNQSNSE